MVRPFDDTTRRNIAELCAAFARLPASEPAPAPKRAAVAIVLVEADDADDGTAFVLTRLAPGHVLGLLDDYPTRSGYLITPVVLWSANGAILTPSPDEVASAHRIALEDIERADAFDFTAIPESTR